MPQQLGGMGLNHLTEMGGDDGAGIHHRIAEGLGMLLGAGLDPGRLQTKGGVLTGDALQGAVGLPGIDGHLAVGVDLRLAHNHPLEGDAVVIGAQIEVVANMHRRHQEAQLLGHFLAHPLDARHQLPPLIGIH